MPFEIIADKETTQETIDQLIAEVPRVFPHSVGISLVDSGLRYDATRLLRPLPQPLDSSLYLSSPIELAYLNGCGYLDIAEIEEILPSARSSETLLLTHHSFAFSPKRLITVFMDFFHEGKEVSVVGQFGGTFYFAGEYSGLERRAVVGIVNAPNKNNIKIVAHELAHQYIRENCASDDLSSGRACLMNPSGPIAEDVTAVPLTFCEPCYAKLGLPIRMAFF